MCKPCCIHYVHINNICIHYTMLLLLATRCLSCFVYNNVYYVNIQHNWPQDWGRYQCLWNDIIILLRFKDTYLILIYFWNPNDKLLKWNTQISQVNYHHNYPQKLRLLKHLLFTDHLITELNLPDYSLRSLQTEAWSSHIHDTHVFIVGLSMRLNVSRREYLLLKWLFTPALSYSSNIISAVFTLIERSMTYKFVTVINSDDLTLFMSPDCLKYLRLKI